MAAAIRRLCLISEVPTVNLSDLQSESVAYIAVDSSPEVGETAPPSRSSGGVYRQLPPPNRTQPPAAAAEAACLACPP